MLNLTMVWPAMPGAHGKPTNNVLPVLPVLPAGLRCLHVDYSDVMAGGGITTALPAATSLRRLHLGRGAAQAVTEECFARILQHLPHLHVLTISSAWPIAAALEALRASLPPAALEIQQGRRYIFALPGSLGKAGTEDYLPLPAAAGGGIHGFDEYGLEGSDGDFGSD